MIFTFLLQLQIGLILVNDSDRNFLCTLTQYYINCLVGKEVKTLFLGARDFHHLRAYVSVHIYFHKFLSWFQHRRSISQ